MVLVGISWYNHYYEPWIFLLKKYIGGEKYIVLCKAVIMMRKQRKNHKQAIVYIKYTLCLALLYPGGSGWKMTWTFSAPPNDYYKSVGASLSIIRPIVYATRQVWKWGAST